MKNFVAAAALFLACSFSTVAQEQKLSAEEKAKVEAYKLANDLGLQGKQHEEFMTMMANKYQTDSNPEMSNERKAEMARIVDRRLRETLTAEQLKKLENHPYLLNTPSAAAPTPARSAK